MIWKGFRFGMILQLAIGPMCVFVFQAAIARGFWAGELGVLGTAVVDSTEILLAIVGVGALLQSSARAGAFLRVFGVVILAAFGLVYLWGAIAGDAAMGMERAFENNGGIFFQAILLALSDPLTIVFWAGIFSAKLTEERFARADLIRFAGGCILATLFFLSCMSLTGSITKQVLPPTLIRVLNGFVGLLMLYFAYRNLRKKPGGAEADSTQPRAS